MDQRRGLAHGTSAWERAHRHQDDHPLSELSAKNRPLSPSWRTDWAPIHMKCKYDRPTQALSPCLAASGLLPAPGDEMTGSGLSVGWLWARTHHSSNGRRSPVVFSVCGFEIRPQESASYFVRGPPQFSVSFADLVEARQSRSRIARQASSSMGTTTSMRCSDSASHSRRVE